MTPPLDLADIQGNLLQGYRARHVRHFALTFADAAAGKAFVAGLVSGDESACPQITTAESWDQRPAFMLNAGFTWAGLRALGVDATVLAAFPAAFQQGPAVRALAPDPDFPNSVGLGDVGPSAPSEWILGGPGNPVVHAVLSLHADAPAERSRVSQTLRGVFSAHSVTEIACHDGNRLPGGTVHFGYRDGIAQPHIAGSPGTPYPDMQPEAPAGDFLLGKDYVNLYGGNFAGDLPAALADNASYGALRILRQDVAGFEELLTRWAAFAHMDRQMIAAKLMGRWRSGAPLTLTPDADGAVPEHDLNRFDYAPTPAHPVYFDDPAGLRCPVGSHIRRLNPRSALVMGKPHSRRLVRRSLPYGPPFDPTTPDDGVERGLIGFFVCGDLELQYEFILRVWANEDLSTHGLRGTREPVLGAQPAGGGTFTIRTSDSRDPIVLGGLPTLTDTRGSVYCLLPGIGGLKTLGAPA